MPNCTVKCDVSTYYQQIWRKWTRLHHPIWRSNCSMPTHIYCWPYKYPSNQWKSDWFENGILQLWITNNNDVQSLCHPLVYPPCSHWNAHVLGIIQMCPCSQIFPWLGHFRRVTLELLHQALNHREQLVAEGSSLLHPGLGCSHLDDAADDVGHGRSDTSGYRWGFPKMGSTPIAGWFIWEILLKIDDLGYPYFRKPPYRSWMIVWFWIYRLIHINYERLIFRLVDHSCGKPNVIKLTTSEW